MAVPHEMLLHPELLSNEQLTHIIEQRHLRIDGIEKMLRDDLLDLFHQYCVPYGQRKYRDSGRGKILNRTRHISPEPSRSLNKIKETRHTTVERIKPPPDLLSGHMKRIKLENVTTKCSHMNSNNHKRKIINDPNSEPIQAKKERKVITWP
ncbi:ashwin [Bombyx mori]|uniref:Ashwin n=1 Tax=Bombyx mori TaxID=7091 RepID=A0A8R2AK98_BOMMO|nr:ashwin [Bombyx mori]